MAWEGEERRSARRARCKLPIELSREGSFPTLGETTDVALTGCYITTMFPLPIGTRLAGALSIGSRKIKVTCEVITMDPSLGNGMKFIGMSEEDKAELRAYLENTQPHEEDPDSGYIIR